MVSSIQQMNISIFVERRTSEQWFKVTGPSQHPMVQKESSFLATVGAKGIEGNPIFKDKCAHNQSIALYSRVVLQMDQSQSFVVEQVKSFLIMGVLLSAGFPLDLIRTRLQTIPELMRQGLISRPYNGVGDCVRQIAQKEGYRAFWKGNLTNLLRIYPNEFSNYLIKEVIQVRAKKYQFGAKHKTAVNFLSSSVGAACTIAFIYPLEFARSRLNNDITGKGPVKIIKDVFKAEGLRGIYRGSINFFLGGIVFRSLYFGAYDTWKEHTPDELIYRVPGCFMGTLAAIFSVYPSDTIRKRMVMTSGHHFKYDGFFDCLKTIYKREGIRGYYKGWQLGISQGVTACMGLLVLDKMGTSFKSRLASNKEKQQN